MRRSTRIRQAKNLHAPSEPGDASGMADMKGNAEALAAAPPSSLRPGTTGAAIAARVRGRIAEMSTTESSVSRAMGWTRTVLSTTLRRLDGEPGPDAQLDLDTVRRLELALGRPAQWILTGVEPAGVRLGDCPGWAEAATLAAERWGISERVLDLIAEARMPVALRYVEASLIRQLSDAL